MIWFSEHTFIPEKRTTVSTPKRRTTAILQKEVCRSCVGVSLFAGPIEVAVNGSRKVQSEIHLSWQTHVLTTTQSNTVYRADAVSYTHLDVYKRQV